VDLSIESFPVDSVTEEILNTVTPLAEAKGLGLTADVPENLTLECDKRRFKQILMNLLSNAIKFSDEGKIDIKVNPLGDGIEVRVSDQGIGIREEDIKRLFNPFGQIDMSTTKKYEGTGLGLYLCKKILAHLGGAISVESEYGKGSVFTFVLPIKCKDGGHEKSADH
jgi:signal transduction histidine kinase